MSQKRNKKKTVRGKISNFLRGGLNFVKDTFDNMPREEKEKFVLDIFSGVIDTVFSSSNEETYSENEESFSGNLENKSSTENVELYPDIDWFCDHCEDYINGQPGFYDSCVDWTCTSCGNDNPINESEIIYDDEDDGFNYDLSPEDFDDNPGCSVCGNPHYPKCQTSCPMFDN